MTRRVAFFRGINVGGNNIVTMAELRATFESLGYERVASHIQSGNVCFDSNDTSANVRDAIITAVDERLGIRVPVVLRSGAELSAAVEAHPFPPGDLEPKFHHVMFLADDPPPDAVALLADRSSDDVYAVIGRQVHVVYPHGSARSRFTVDWVDRQLGTVATARNLSTCRKVLALLVR